MVLLFPSTADRFKHYSTTNGVYGDFYGSTMQQIWRDCDPEAEFNPKLAETTEQLQQGKACLQGADYSGAVLDQGQRRPRSAPQGKDCGQQREPEFLEDHVRHYHPHLAPKPQFLPKVLWGRSNRPLPRGAYYRRGGSAGGFGVGLNSEGVSSRSNSRSRKRPGSLPPVAKKSALPATSRYNFYRYYGRADQGAKTSQDYCAKP